MLNSADRVTSEKTGSAMEGHTRMESGDNLTDGTGPVESTAESPSIPKMNSCETTQSDTVPDQNGPTGEQSAQSDEGTVEPEVPLPTAKATREVQSETMVTPSSPDVEAEGTSDCSFEPILSRASLTLEAEKPSDQSICPGTEGSSPRPLASATREEQIEHNMENASQYIEPVATPELLNAELEESGDQISPVDDTRDVLKAEKQTDQSVNPSLDVPSTDQDMENAEISDEQAIASPVPDSQEEDNTDDLVGLSAVSTEEHSEQTADIHVSAEPMVIPALPDAEMKDINDSNIDSVDSVVAGSVSMEEHSEQTADIHVSAEPMVIPALPDAEMKDINDSNIDSVDSVVAGSVSMEEHSEHTTDIHVSAEPMVIPALPDAEMKDINDSNIDSVDSIVADSVSTEEHSEQTADIHVSAEPMVIPALPDAEIKDVNNGNIDPVDSVMAGIISTEEQPEQTADVHVEPTIEPTLINASTKENSDTAESVVASATITTCNKQQIDNSVEANLPAPVINIQTELGKESPSVLSVPIDEPYDETAIARIESGSPAPDPSMPTVEPISVSEAEHISYTIHSEEPTNSSRVESGADPSKELVNSINGENTGPDTGSIISTMIQIKKEKSPDSEMTPQNEQFDEPAVGDSSGSNEIELAEYQWSNDQSFPLESNVSQDNETDGDPNIERSWQGQAMLEVVGCESGDPPYSVGEMPNLNFCIDSVRGDVPWPPSGGEDEGNDAAGTSEQVMDSHRIRFKTRGRGRGGVDLLALPYLRQKNRAGTADGYYSLNSNVKGLLAWLSHSKGPYTMTVTLFGFKVVEEPPDAAETSFTCELCKSDYTDVETFLGHCRETRHIANKAAAVQRSLKLYVRQIMARTQAKKVQDGGSVVNTVSTIGASNIGLVPNVYEPKVHRGGRRGRGRPFKQKYEHKLQFTQKRKLQQPPNPLLPKRGRGRPRKIQPDSSLVGMTEGNQPLLNTLPFEKTKPSGEEDKRILRVKPLPRQEDRRTPSVGIDSTECPMDEEACDSDGPPPPTVPHTVTHGTSLSDISSPMRALFDHSETSPGHSAEPRRKRHRYSTENPQESDASSTSASVRSHRRSSREPMDSPRYEDHTPTKTNPGEVLRRGRGRPRKKIHDSGMTPNSTLASSPVAQASNSLGISSGISLPQALPVPVVKLERTMPEKLLGTRKERVEPGPSSTITSASSFGNEELLNSLTDEQLWAELLERKTVHSCTCGFAFSTSSAYYLHKACHNTVNEKTCSFCGLEATNWMMFHAHFFNHKAPT